MQWSAWPSLHALTSGRDTRHGKQSTHPGPWPWWRSAGPFV